MRTLIFLALICSTQFLFAQYENPVFINPGDNIQSIINANPDGTLYIFKEGTHWRHQIIPKSGDILIGEPGAILNGGLALDNWIQEGLYWTHTIPAEYAATQYMNAPDWVCENTSENGVTYPSDVCLFPQSLFKDNLPLWRVPSLDFLDNVQDSTNASQIASPIEPFYGDWYFDVDSLKVYLAFDPTSFIIESTTKIPGANYAIHPGGGSVGGVAAKDILLKGLTIEKYAPTWSAIICGSEDWVIENNDIQLNHTAGTGQAGNGIIRSNKINRNGQKGMGGTSSGLVDNNEIAYNNFNRFLPGWDAVTKWIGSDGLIFRNNYVHDNYGFGLWCDHNNINITYEGNLIENNGGAGIHHEISQDAVIRCNQLINNRHRAKPPAGTHDNTQNLYISNGSYIKIEHNYIRNDFSGRSIVVVQYLRDSLGLYPGTPVEVQHNDIVYSRVPINNVVASWGAPESFPFYGDSLPVHFFDNNHYHIAEFDPNKFYFGHLNDDGIGTPYSWVGFQAAGHELNGTADDNIIDAPNYPECADIPKQMLIKAKLLLSCLMEDGATEMTLPNSEDRVHFQPFSGEPWNYQGKDVCPKLYDNMVDWVLLEIREAANPTNILQQKAAILLKDGSVVDAYPSLLGVAQPGDMLDGVVIYDLIPNVEYFLSIKTRQQTLAMANHAIVLPNDTAYDFTNPNEVENLDHYENITGDVVALQSIDVTAMSNETDICLGESVNLTATPNLFFNNQQDPVFNWNNGLSNEDSLTVSPTETTTYQIELTDEFGCSTFDEVEIMVHSIPDAPTISGATEVVVGNEEIYQITNPNLTSNFEWTIAGGTVIDNLNNIITILWDGMPPFEICAVETSEFDCVGEESCTLIDIINGTNDLQLARNIVVFPNPTSGVFFIKTTSEIQIQEVIIFDSFGKLVLQQQDLEINLKTAAKGVYWVKVETKEGAVFKRITLL